MALKSTYSGSHPRHSYRNARLNRHHHKTHLFLAKRHLHIRILKLEKLLLHDSSDKLITYNFCHRPRKGQAKDDNGGQ
jgi:hypothetical protein